MDSRATHVFNVLGAVSTDANVWLSKGVLIATERDIIFGLAVRESCIKRPDANLYKVIAER